MDKTYGSFNASKTSVNLSTWKPFAASGDGRSVFDITADLIGRHYSATNMSDADKTAEVKALADNIAKAMRDAVWEGLSKDCVDDNHYNRVMDKDPANPYSVTIYDYRDIDLLEGDTDTSVKTKSLVKGQIEVIEDVDAVYGWVKSPIEIQAGTDNLDDNRIPLKLPLIDNEVMGISTYSVARYKETTTYSDAYLKKLADWRKDYREETRSFHQDAYTEQVPAKTTQTVWINGEKKRKTVWDGVSYNTINHPEINYNYTVKVYNSPKPEPGEDDITTTREYAPDDFTIISDAIKYVTNERARIGAEQNRLEHAYKINTNTVENTQAAESLIRDTDMAKEMVRYSKENILQQAGQAMLSQANQQPQSVLQLLQ